MRYSNAWALLVLYCANSFDSGEHDA